MEDENMDGEEDIFAGIQLPYEGSGSEYENSEEEALERQKTKAKTASKSKASSSSLETKRKTGKQKAAQLFGSKKGIVSVAEKEAVRHEEGNSSTKDDQVSRKNGQSQNLDPAEPSANPIRLPLREFTKNNLKRKESPVTIDSDEPKKRWKQASNPRYLSLLNVDITDTIARTISNDNIKLDGSQIGSSIWTALEKDQFFIALSRLGRDNVKAISARIGTKSELEVQEYMQLLHTEFSKRRIDGRILELPDFPAALEISEECTNELEKAADKLSSRQEKSEIEVEREKWGDSWLLTPEIGQLLNKRRNQDGGKQAIDEILPAANLFNLDKWLELSGRIFMNPSDSEENWRLLGDEPPSVRATAFEDFHSLAVFITKKLVSTTLYCTMSRERATQAQKTKHADVTPADVEAAVNILNLTHNSDEFWKKSARRCNLEIVDDDDTTVLPYADVEAELATMPHSRRSRSRSTSRPPMGIDTLPSSEETSLGDFESANNSSSEYEEEEEDDQGGTLSDVERSKVARDREAKVQAMDAYTESLDQKNSREEEAKMWKILGKAPTETSRVDEEEKELVRPRRLVNLFDEQLGWREHVKFRSEWEVMEGVVEEREFEKNRNRVVKHRRSVRSRSAVADGRPRGGLSSEFVDEVDEDLALSAHTEHNVNESGSESREDEEDDEGSDRLSDRSSHEDIVGSIEADTELVSSQEGRSHRGHEVDNESVEEDNDQSEDSLEEDEFMGAHDQPENVSEEEED